MKRIDPFEAAYCSTLAAVLLFIILLVMQPTLVIAPLAVWLVSAAVMLREYRRAVIRDRLDHARCEEQSDED